MISHAGVDPRPDIKQLNDTITKYNEINSKLSNRMLWLTVAIAILTVIYTAVSIAQLIVSLS